MRQQDIKIIAPLSHGLSKTGQVVSYRTGDDGNHEVGWWLGLSVVNNRTRHIEKEFVAGEPVIIDLATRLMWPKDIDGDATDNGDTKTWFQAIDFCNALVFGGFSDWRLSNVLEFASLIRYSDWTPCTFIDVFDNFPNTANFWTSSTWPGITTYANRIYLADGFGTSGKVKTYDGYRILPCRSI